MAISLELPAQYGDARECLRAAQGNLEKVRKLLAQPSLETSDAAAALLREVEIQLGCVAALWKNTGAERDVETKKIVAGLQREVAILAEIFAQSDKLFTGWLRAIQSKRAGYTGQGQAAPLVLVSQVSLEG